MLTVKEVVTVANKKVEECTANGCVKPPEDGRFGTRVGVIGGLGEMGSLFARFFKERGYRVDVADRATERTNEELVRDSDIVIFAVPLHETENVIRSLAPHVTSNHLLMDLTSLKSGPVREMLRSSASVVGLHPMFGGRVSSFSGQTMIACPVRIDPLAWAGLREVFTQAGLRIKECTPEEHDRMMSIIQVLFHMTTMLVGRILRDLDVNIEDTLEYTSPSYRIEMSLLGRIFAQNGLLYSAITQMNPHTREMIDLFRSGLDSYAKWYDEKDLSAFVRDFERSSKHIGDFCRRAYQESSAVLDFAVRYANENNGPRENERS